MGRGSVVVVVVVVILELFEAASVAAGVNAWAVDSSEYPPK
jgi:hypothetical protein